MGDALGLVREGYVGAGVDDADRRRHVVIGRGELTDQIETVGSAREVLESALDVLGRGQPVAL
ncbi:hypothetical protein [Streptomyces deccanensis]|uniref:hypothetical protein n=1 Tax=Streptomyces deccanensis TaxID=424188 RepID=UPI001EFB6FEC|nr:hypothetical protein [Streptomyces deccanensis]ULR55004.1 hypothetical protein L3078_40160 [Streptomyces deccanensis]